MQGILQQDLQHPWGSEQREDADAGILDEGTHSERQELQAEHRQNKSGYGGA